MSVPQVLDRVSRDKCWAARDAFFACSDPLRAGLESDSEKDSRVAKQCRSQLRDYESLCPKSWVFNDSIYPEIYFLFLQITIHFIYLNLSLFRFVTSTKNTLLKSISDSRSYACAQSTQKSRVLLPMALPDDITSSS